jgi:hypothetical protein
MALLASYVRFPEHVVRENLVEWLVENADMLLTYAQERNRLTWLRMNPESCRASKDCRNKRAESYIFCAECLNDGDGGYFDVYQRFYDEQHTAFLDAELKKRFGI